MPHSTTSFEKSENGCGFLVRTLPAILVQNKWIQRVPQLICDGKNTQIYPKRFISRGERSIWVPPALLGRERPPRSKALSLVSCHGDQVRSLEVILPLLVQQSRRHTNGPFSATNEPFGINLSVFPITNHLGNTLESFVLHKNNRIYANSY